jgi:hypothetical protein
MTSWLIGWLGCWLVLTAACSHHGALAGLDAGAHLRGHHASLGGGAWSHLLPSLAEVGGHRFFELDSLDVLLIFDFLLDILVSLEELVVLRLSQLQALVEVGLELLLECIHFVLLLLDELGLGSDDFLVTLLHVLLSLIDLEVLAFALDLVCLGVALLSGEVTLDLLGVEELT